MTIVVATAAPDGLVLATDSRSTLLQGRRHRVATDHARKLFSPYEGIAMATFGTALIGTQTIAGIVDEFVGQRTASSGTTIDDVSRDAAEYFTECLGEQERAAKRELPAGALGLLIAGYTPDGIGQIDEVLLPATEDRNAIVRLPVGTHDPGVLFRGRTQYIRRMVEGYDVDGVRRADIRMSKRLDRDLRGLGYYLKDLISLQDALDMAAFIVRLTIDMERLTDGTFTSRGDVPACGGSVQALLVSRGESRWIAQPQLRVSDAGLSE